MVTLRDHPVVLTTGTNGDWIVEQETLIEE
jgi:hypothetical protein